MAGSSMKSLFATGQISGRQMRNLSRRFQTGKDGSGVPTKMTDFDEKTKDEGKVRQTGEVPGNEINHPTNQKKKQVGKVTRGARVAGKEHQVKVNQIDDAGMQRPQFPSGAKIAGSGNDRVGVRGAVGKSSGGPYGGPSSRAKG